MWVWSLVGAAIGWGILLMIIGALILVDGFYFDVWGWKKRK